MRASLKAKQTSSRLEMNFTSYQWAISKAVVVVVLKTVLSLPVALCPVFLVSLCPKNNSDSLTQQQQRSWASGHQKNKAAIGTATSFLIAHDHTEVDFETANIVGCGFLILLQ